MFPLGRRHRTREERLTFYMLQVKQLLIDETQYELNMNYPPHEWRLFYMEKDGYRRAFVMLNPIRVDYILRYAVHLIVCTKYAGNWDEYYRRPNPKPLVVSGANRVLGQMDASLLLDVDDGTVFTPVFY